MKSIKKTTVPEWFDENMNGLTSKATMKTEKRSHKIGSHGVGKINFDPKDHFFHLDGKLQTVKQEVKGFIDPDILGLKRPGWNSSSSVEPGPRLDQQKHLFNIRVGLADLKITQLNTKKGYAGCDELRKDFSGWNVSHQVNKKEFKQRDDRMLDTALRSTFRRTAQTLENWATQGKAYLRPTEYVTHYNEKLRKQKEDEKMQRERILREAVDVAASKEKKAALVFRYLEEKKRVDAQLAKKKEEKEFTGKPNMAKTLKNWKEYEYYHPGKWTKPKIHDKEMWTCCASEVKESRGCQFRIKDKMAWQFST